MANKKARESKGKMEDLKALTSNFKQINLNAAGIDVGSEKHYVAVPEDRDKDFIRSFGCFTSDLYEMANWLTRCGIETIAMESTGVYWIPVFQVLESRGFDVKLVNARHIKNVPGRKTDIQDCQWIQQLHTFGLLRGSFRPDSEVCKLRTLWRHRDNLVQYAGAHIQHMQKALTQMNIQLHKVISDITGVTGMRIIRAILDGERDPNILAGMKHSGIKSSHKDIVKSLQGDYREEHLFCLRQALEMYDIYHKKIEECDEQTENQLKNFESKTQGKNPNAGESKSHIKNKPKFDLQSHLYRITGVDLTKIDGIDVITAQTIITEWGTDMSKFPTEKHISSWLGLSPDNRISGDKVLKRKTKRVNNRSATALRLAATTLIKSKSALGAYHRRMRARLGAPKAITATAHKLCRIVYRMLKYGEEYVDQGQKYYEEKYKERVLKNLAKRAENLGFLLIPQIIANPLTAST